MFLRGLPKYNKQFSSPYVTNESVYILTSILFLYQYNKTLTYLNTYLFMILTIDIM